MKYKEMIEICENCKIKDNCSHRILVNMEKCKVNDCDYFKNISTDKEKQIEEMAKDFKSYLPSAWYNDKCINGEVYSMVKHAYEDNYRKITDSVVLSKEEYEKLKYQWITDSEAYKKGGKETVEKIFPEKLKKFAERLKEKMTVHYPSVIESIDETLKEFIDD